MEKEYALALSRQLTGGADEKKLVDDEGREYRVCPQCAYNMYKQGRMWVCENCGYSYVE